jgi:hydrogenase maturation protein HypF
VVQGVGFRPYVYRLARELGLAGFVLNSSTGATIEVEGDSAALAEFLVKLPTHGPRLMQITDVHSAAIGPLGEAEFLIRDSVAAGDAFARVPVDVSACEECLAEVRDPADRRFAYPFTNCTNCGPRYSIILDVPYDRLQTTMAPFAMCVDCSREYHDPADRRFHAQPNACPVCGPRLELKWDGATGEGELDARRIVDKAAGILLAGGIVAWKGLGGYQLACDASRADAVQALRRRKHRSEKAFAVMVADTATAESLCEVSEAEQRALVSRERPIVLLRRNAQAAIAEEVSPANPLTGVMLPCTPMHEMLFKAMRDRQQTGKDPVLVMTSGNVSDEPIMIDNAEAEKRLAGIADAFVHHNRGIHTRVDDSVVRVFDGVPMLLRRARGYAPDPIWLGLGDAEVLACGAQQKSALCLTKSGFAMPSQHLGDLENYETLEFFEQTLARMQRLFHANPTVVAHDLHPGYLSTQFAKKFAAEKYVAVQHHHAHIASCMAEHRLRGKVIGVAWDGTGLGTDGRIWGGEFLVADLDGFERFAHLRNVPMAGGDAAVREPWRMARSYLRDAFEDQIPRSIALPEAVSADKLRLLDTMLERRLNAVETSSCGRLFDAVAAIVGLRQTVSFEGQAAMLLEAVAEDGGGAQGEAYEFALNGEQCGEVDLRPMIRQVVEDVKRGVPAARISARFHATLIAVVVHVCLRARIQYPLNRVCLSGGCFQNFLLLSGCVGGLRAEGFDVYFQQQIPANDGGISLGQAAIACEAIARNRL